MEHDTIPSATDPTSLLGRFIAYAQAFEETYADDDWTRLDAFLAPDVVYRVLGSPGWDCVVEGRPAVCAAIRRFLDGFDRHCTRRIGAGAAPPLVDDQSVRVVGTATYRHGDSDELVLELEILAEYRDGLIVALSDVYPWRNGARTRAWMERWGRDLSPSYV